MHLRRFGPLILPLVGLLLSLRVTNSEIPRSLACGHGFFEAHGSCFNFNSHFDVWDNAQTFCLVQGAEVMRRFPDSETFRRLFQEFSIKLAIKKLWIHKNPPQVSGASQHCTVVAADSPHRVYLMDCNSRLPYICRRDLWTFFGACPDGFFSAGSWCYRVFGTMLDRVLTEEADKRCKRAGGSLARIEHIVQLAAIRSHMEGRAQVDVLVRLSREFNESTSNIVGQNDASLHRVLGIYSVLPGSITEARKDTHYGYVCERERERVGVQNSTTVQRIFSGSWQSRGCPAGFASYGVLGNLCVRLRSEAKSWAEARRDCRALDADLVSIVSEFEQANVLLQRVMAKDDLWLGLKDEAWSDGTEYAFSLLRAGERGCRAVTMEGAWRAVNCSRPMPFLCAARKRRPPEVIDVTRTCAFQNASLAQFRSFCYKIVAKNEVREKAKDYCASHFKYKDLSVSAQRKLDQYTERNTLGFVLEVESKEELAFVIHMQRRLSNRTWRSFWVEKTDNYVGWSTNRIASGRGKNSCIVSLMNGEWEYSNCNTHQYFVCKTPTIPSGVVKTEKETNGGKDLKLYILTLSVCFGVLFMFVVVCVSWFIFKRFSKPPAQLITDSEFAPVTVPAAKSMSQLLEEPPPDDSFDDVYEEMETNESPQ